MPLSLESNGTSIQAWYGRKAVSVLALLRHGRGAPSRSLITVRGRRRCYIRLISAKQCQSRFMLRLPFVIMPCGRRESWPRTPVSDPRSNKQREPAKGELPSVVDLPGALQKQAHRGLLAGPDQQMTILN
jgi:hypothetical protein